MLRPKVVAEVGTLFGGTTETLARALWESGHGVIHTTDPFGADRCPAIIGSWPRGLQEITEFHPLNSMDFFGALAQRRIMLFFTLSPVEPDMRSMTRLVFPAVGRIVPVV